jgi:hypothetical protein
MSYSAATNGPKALAIHTECRIFFAFWRHFNKRVNVDIAFRRVT